MDCSIEGDIDLQGILGLSDDGPQRLPGHPRRASSSKGDAPAEKLRKIVEQSVARSAVFDILTNGVPVAVTAEA